MGTRAQTALLFPFPLSKWEVEKLTIICHASFLLGESRQCHRVRACLLCLLPLGAELHRVGSLNSAFLASQHAFCAGVRARAVLLCSELAFILFAHTITNVALGLACLENGCNGGAKM